MRARSSGWTSTPRWPCARRRTRRSSSRPTSSRRGEADAVVTAGHTGAGMAAAVLRLGACRASTVPPWRSRSITDSGPIVLLDIGANPDSTPENLAQFAQMGAIFAERVLGVAEPRVALLSIGEEKGKGDARIQRGDGAARRVRPALRGQRRGQGPDPPPGRRRRAAMPSLGNVVIKFFEGLSGVHLRPVADRVRGSLARQARRTC